MAAWMENGPSRDGRHWISTPRLLKSWSRNPQGLLFSLPLHLLVHQDLLQTLWAPTLGFKPGQSLALPYTPSRQSTNGQHNEKKKGVEKIGKEVMAAKVCFPNPSPISWPITIIFVLQIGLHQHAPLLSESGYQCIRLWWGCLLQYAIITGCCVLLLLLLLLLFVFKYQNRAD